MTNLSARVASSAVVLTLLAALFGGERVVRADDAVTPASCVAANEAAGPLRRAGKLREARARLRFCSAQSCPGVVRKDCVAGAAQADADVPTIAFSVHDADGNDLSAVHVSLDGQPLAERLDGTALEVDPGEHLFKFESPAMPTVEKRLVIVEGEKNRHERVQMGEPKAVVVVGPRPTPFAPAAPAPPALSNDRRNVGFAVGGAGLVLLAAGGASGLVATLKWGDAKDACGPTFPVSCANKSGAASDRSTALTTSTLADIGLAVGGVALVAGAVIVLTAPPPGPRDARSATLTLAPQVGPQANGVLLMGTF
jgi:hypothetical protein